METIRSNVDNLTDLWQQVNRKAEGHMIKDVFEYGIVDYSEWPNRLWFKNIPEQEDIDLVKKIISQSPVRITVPYWNVEGNEYKKLLVENGFTKVLEQVGMALNLTNGHFEPSNIKLRRVKDETTAQLWASLFHKAFGYHISSRLVLKTCEEINYLIAYDHDLPIGTVIVHNSGREQVGIHAMGIIPEMRRRGYAEQLMRSILSVTIAQGSRYATLQASEMGKGLYLKLGFKEQFQMENYILQGWPTKTGLKTYGTGL